MKISYRTSHVVSITSVPTDTDDARDKRDRLDSVLRALAGFNPQPVRVGQRAYDDRKKVIRIDFAIYAESDFEAQLEAIRIMDALAPALATAQYCATAWNLENPATAV